MVPPPIERQHRRSLQSWHKTPSGWRVDPSTNDRRRQNGSGGRLTEPLNSQTEKRRTKPPSNKHLRQGEDHTSSDWRTVTWHITHVKRTRDWIETRQIPHNCHTLPGAAQPELSIDNRRILVWRSTDDEATQPVVPETLQAPVLYLESQPLIAGYPSQSRIYHMLRQEYNRPHMANYVTVTLAQCMSCVWNESQYKK